MVVENLLTSQINHQDASVEMAKTEKVNVTTAKSPDILKANVGIRKTRKHMIRKRGIEIEIEIVVIKQIYLKKAADRPVVVDQGTLPPAQMTKSVTLDLSS
jgi:hypothetical protein